MGQLCHQRITMRLVSDLLPALVKNRDLRGRNAALNDVQLFLGKFGKGRNGKTERLGENLGRRVPEPVGGAERAEFRKRTVVEDQHEVGFAWPEPLQHVAMPARKVPDIARVEVVDLRRAVGADDRGADPSLDDKSPLGGDRMPVQLADAAGIQAHRDPGQPLGYRQLFDGRLPGRAAVRDMPLVLFHGESERRQLFRVLLTSFVSLLVFQRPRPRPAAPAARLAVPRNTLT